MFEKIKQILIKVKARELSIEKGSIQIMELFEKEIESEREYDRSWDNLKSGDMK